ncbi:MAG: hypothetical protein ACREJC_05775, partial [Tepidisphaeraceae bacterium]
GMASALGIDLPRCYGPATPAIAAQAEVQFPVVVKPVFGHSFFTRFGCKLFTARDRADLDRYISLTTQAGEPCEMFDLIPGPATSIFAYTTYIDSRGEPSGGLTIRKLRLSPAFAGVSRVAEIVPDIPVMRDATIAFARRAGFRGMTDTEFKLDPRDGSYRFLEVNGRSVLFNSLLRRGGLDLAALAWGDYVEEQPQRVHPSGWPGVWVNLHADLLYSLLRHRQERLSFSAFLAPYRRPVIDAVWSARDPLPFFAQWSRTAGEAACAVLRGRLGKTLADHTGSTYDP